MNQLPDNKLHPSVDIVLPCYNPPNGWYKELLEFYSKASDYQNIKFILVNDGSTNKEFEKSFSALDKNRVPYKVITYTVNMGKGFALRQGINASESDYVLYTDVDFPFTDESTLNLLSLICSGKYDVLAGSRDESYYLKKMSGFRKLLSKSFRMFLRIFIRMKITDTQCGLKAFSKRGKSEFLKTKINRYLFDFEFIYRCSKIKDIRISPVPVILKENVQFSKMRPKILFQEFFNLFQVILFRKS